MQELCRYEQVSVSSRSQAAKSSTGLDRPEHTVVPAWAVQPSSDLSATSFDEAGGRRGLEY